jgi:hypothetical protein
LRDSQTSRLVAYAPEDHMLYATDGCNACVKTVDLAAAGVNRQMLEECTAISGVPRPLLERLIALAVE